MNRTSPAAPATPSALRASQAGSARHRTTHRLVETCVLLVAFVSGAVALASNLAALLRD